MSNSGISAAASLRIPPHNGLMLSEIVAIAAVVTIDDIMGDQVTDRPVIGVAFIPFSASLLSSNQAMVV